VVVAFGASAARNSRAREPPCARASWS
jgi:hypothetical protein